LIPRSQPHSSKKWSRYIVKKIKTHAVTPVNIETIVPLSCGGTPIQQPDINTIPTKAIVTHKNVSRPNIIGKSTKSRHNRHRKFHRKIPQ
jgi:hypothetical protein